MTRPTARLVPATLDEAGIAELLTAEAATAAVIAARRFPNDTAAAHRYFLELLAEVPAEVADPDRFCPTCGADIIGNDPHEPGCEAGEEEAAIHTSCAICGQDIEGWAGSYDWRDRGNSAECVPYPGFGLNAGEMMTPPTGTRHRPALDA